MKFTLVILVLFVSCTSIAQKKRTKVPSYFGLQIRPVFPTRFIGEPTLNLRSPESDQVQIESVLTQRMGYSFGATIRAGVTKLIAIETGINFTRRNFDIDYSIPDSNLTANVSLGFISYDIPLNALFYIKLADKWYMNTALGLAVNFAPTDVGKFIKSSGDHEFRANGLVRNKFGFDLNASVGFEFRTEKSGFFYLGGSGRVPFAPIFDLFIQYKNQGYKGYLTGEVDGTFLSIELKYFFPTIKNKGWQFKKGPIDQ